jgi:hypothetical protein
LSAANQPVGTVVAAAGIADSDDSQILVVKLCHRSKVDACRRVVITAGKI